MGRAKIIVVGAVGMNISRKEFYEKELELVVSKSYGPGRYDTKYEEEVLITQLIMLSGLKIEI